MGKQRRKHYQLAKRHLLLPNFPCDFTVNHHDMKVFEASNAERMAPQNHGQKKDRKKLHREISIFESSKASHERIAIGTYHYIRENRRKDTMSMVDFPCDVSVNPHD